MLADPINENTSKNRQVDVFPLVFVSADNINVSALVCCFWVGGMKLADLDFYEKVSG